MTTIAEYNGYGEELERLLLLRTSPIAVKMLEKEDDLPAGAVRPWKDRGIHIAQCQAFAMSRRAKETVAMLKEDSWCFAPLIAYGMVNKPDDPEFQQFLGFPRFERGRYIGIVSAPLRSAGFEPDVVLIYSNNSQLRSMLQTTHFQNREARVDSHFFPPACAYAIVPVILKGELTVILPDIGEYHRALSTEDEIILSVPKDKIAEIVEGVGMFQEGEFGYKDLNMYMQHDFPHPPMYETFFKRWGLYG